MAETAVLFGKNLTLQDLSVQVAAYEAGLGTLAAIGRTQDKTAAVFHLDGSSQNDLKLELDGGTVPPGYVKVCSGKVWVSGQHQDVIAIREN